MLIINRKLNEVLRIGEARVVVLEITPGQVRLGIDAPRNLKVDREETVADRTSPTANEDDANH